MISEEQNYSSPIMKNCSGESINLSVMHSSFETETEFVVSLNPLQARVTITPTLREIGLVFGRKQTCTSHLISLKAKIREHLEKIPL